MTVIGQVIGVSTEESTL